MDTNQIILLILAICLVFWLIIIVSIRHFKKVKKQKENNLIETSKARYTVDTNITKADGETNVTYTQTDNILEQNVTYIIGKKQGIKAGKYVILSTNDLIDTFNIRLGDFVRPYKHGSTIIVKDGEEITPVSCSIILR